ncbi:MAG: endonuclease/exonuclease/phosphatase family protein [Planctomycetota bacterium]
MACTIWVGIASTRVTGAPPSTELKVMSFNVFGGSGLSAVLGEGSWYNAYDPDNARRLMVADVISRFNPDILGLQETSADQTQELEDFLGVYDWYGIGRDDGLQAGEYAAIFFRADRFDLLDQGTFWLSTTPDVPGTVFSGAGSIRAATWIKLFDKQSYQSYFVLNTHLDNVSSSANQQSATLIRAMFGLLADGLPILMTGDFNELETSTTVRRLQGLSPASSPRLYDSYREMFPIRGPNERTYHFDVFTGTSSGSRIDYVLHSDDFEVTAASIIRRNYSGIYPSDHFPVTATFRVAVVPEASSLLLLGSASVVGLVVYMRKSSVQTASPTGAIGTD